MSPNRQALSKFWAVILALGLAACDGEAAPPAPPPPTVAISEIKAGPVPLRFQYAGRVAAFREVEIRARVAGILQEKSFVEGATVNEGDVLFRIDPAPYEAALARAQAQLKDDAHVRVELLSHPHTAERGRTESHLPRVAAIDALLRPIRRRREFLHDTLTECSRIVAL